MTAAAVLFPPEIFVDQLLVTIRDATVRLPGSSLSYHLHARQAAALATQAGLEQPAVAAALLYGYGEVVARSWSRHPSAPVPVDATAAGVAHLRTHLSCSVTQPIALMTRARRYLDEAGHAGMIPTPERLRFETEPHASVALELVDIDRRAGVDAMITPGLDAYRDLLHGLCRPGPPIRLVR